MNVFQIMNLVSEKHPNKFDYAELVLIVKSLSDNEIKVNFDVARTFIEEIGNKNKLKLNIEFEKEMIEMGYYERLFTDLNISLTSFFAALGLHNTHSCLNFCAYIET